jgi:archaemetzincin
MSETIGLVQLGPTADCSVEKLRDRVARKFPSYQVRRLEPIDTPPMAFDPSRNQFHSSRILVALEENTHPARTEHVLGVVAFDLFVPGMNFVFGEARCPGRVAVISTYRLRADGFGGSELFESRVVKEAVHEIGHMLGLKHCSNSSCAMYFSERLADTDRKKDSFCSECEPKLKWVEVE